MSYTKLHQAFGLTPPHNLGDGVQVQETPCECRYWHIKKPGSPPSDMITARDSKPGDMTHVYAYQDCVAYGSKTSEYASVVWAMPQALKPIVYIGAVYTHEELVDLLAKGLTDLLGHDLAGLILALKGDADLMVVLTRGWRRVLQPGDIVEPSNLPPAGGADDDDPEDWPDTDYGDYSPEDSDL